MNKAIPLLVALLLPALACHAQAQQRKANAALIAQLNSVDNSVSQMMSAEGSGIDFDDWDASGPFISAAKSAYEAQKRDAKSLRTLINAVKSSGTSSSSQLFDIYVHLRDIEATAAILERDAFDEQKSSTLATRLSGLRTQLIKQESKLGASVRSSIQQDAGELSSGSTHEN